MTVHAESFVLFSLGKKRFGLPSEKVSELARPDTVHAFPNTTRYLDGVLLRRGELIPVCDIAPVLARTEGAPRKFFLIAKRSFGELEERIAIPVSGDCELASTPQVPITGKWPAYVVGLLSLEDEIIEVLDLEKMLVEEAR